MKKITLLLAVISFAFTATLTEQCTTTKLWNPDGIEIGIVKGQW